MDIAEWLRGLGLGKYAPTFDENAIDWDVLSDLTADDLKDMGVAAVGDRRRLLAAIAALEKGALAAAQAAAAPSSFAPGEAERRQLTVMFCDLVGSTALAARYDPEDLRDIVATYHRTVADSVARFAGFVAKYMGDGVLTYFGYPEAHEDDAERAVRAGLAVIDAVGRVEGPERLRVRLAIASGLVVVGDLIGEGAAQEREVVGETPNLAARLQTLAEPGTLLIADATRRLIGELFDLVDLGPQALAGFAGAQRTWRVVGESAVLSRFEALRSGAMPLFGRGEELDLLSRRWQQAKAGDGRVVLISGEPGIGKSRLTAAFSEMIGGEAHTRLRYFCSPHHQDSALHPFVRQLERAAGFTRDDTTEEKRSKLQGLVAVGVSDGDDLILIEELLSLPNAAAELGLSPQKKREKLFEALLRQLEAIAEDRSVLFIFEDAHWIDPTSHELLDLAVERIRRRSVLLIATFRPEFQPLWVGQPHVTMLTLNRLGGRDVAALVQRLAGDVPLGNEVVEEIVERTDGVPLFVEELTKAVIETRNRSEQVAAVLGASPGAMLSIPATLHASLIARLDRLGTAAREIAQIGAVLGRDFSYELIEPVAQRNAAELQNGLGQLTEAGLLFCRGTPPHSTYLFKHALVQDAAYSTLLRGTRRRLHAQIAAVIEERFTAIVEVEPELLAHHYTEAGDFTKALVYWLQAGQRAAQRSANVEALAHLGRGLELLKALPDTPEARQQEIQFLTARAVVLRVAGGYGSEELLVVLQRAHDLCQQYGDLRQRFRILFGLWAAHAGRGDWLRCRKIAKQSLVIAEKEVDLGMLVEAHRLVGSTAVWLADHRAAEVHLRRAIDLYDPGQHRASAFLYGYDARAASYSYISWSLWLQGKINEGLAASSNSIQLAIESKHVPTLAAIYGWAIFLHLSIENMEALQDLTSKLIIVCERSGLPHWLAVGKIGRGWLLSRTGHSREGIEWLQGGIREFQLLWGGFLVSAWLVWLADALRLAGRYADATGALDRSAEMIEQFNERLWEAENCRMRGEVAREEGNDRAALSAFEKAIAVAQSQLARSLELRASLAWAKLAAAQGRRREARERLAPIYSSFTEGFEITDLRAAKDLLVELT